jgi:hypothetical protein
MKETVQGTARRKSAKSAKKVPRPNAKTVSAKVQALLPPGSPQRAAAEVAAAAGGALLAAATFGVGPAALAGAAGYLAYRRTHGKEQTKEAGVAPHQRSRQ